jgi:D-lyxose ketol-isomerase
MVTPEQHEKALKKACDYFRKAGIVLTDSEKKLIEVADFGLGDLDRTGLQIFTYINTKKVCAKELVLTPYQTCPEHLHPPIGSYEGKEETFRCRFGTVYLYVDGEETEKRSAQPPPGVYTVFREIILRPGDQYTLMPHTRHWFQAGAEGAVVSEFSTSSYDEGDLFTDPKIRRIP